MLPYIYINRHNNIVIILSRLLIGPRKKNYPVKICRKSGGVLRIFIPFYKFRFEEKMGNNKNKIANQPTKLLSYLTGKEARPSQFRKHDFETTSFSYKPFFESANCIVNIREKSYFKLILKMSIKTKNTKNRQ